jgi:four helix bundle protein
LPKVLHDLATGDRKNFMIIARGSAFECVAILEYLFEIDELSKESFDHYVGSLEEISKMLFALIKRMD